MAKQKREYMMAPFRPQLDEDIKQKYFAIPEGKRSDMLRDAFRLYMGINKKLVYEASEKPLTQPTRPLMKGGVGIGNSLHDSRPRRA